MFVFGMQNFRRPKMTKIMMRMMLVVAALFLAVGPMLAQSTTQGAIAGTVFDSTNAAIPNAKIVIHNIATGADLIVRSGGAGEYRAPQLTPGTYTVTTTAANF